jgi:hypothetical protein
MCGVTPHIQQEIVHVSRFQWSKFKPWFIAISIESRARRMLSAKASVVPRRLLYPHSIDSPAEVLAIRGIAIAQQVARSGVPRKGFSYLAREPSCGRMLGDGRSNM